MLAFLFPRRRPARTALPIRARRSALDPLIANSASCLCYTQIMKKAKKKELIRFQSALLLFATLSTVLYTTITISRCFNWGTFESYILLSILILDTLIASLAKQAKNKANTLNTRLIDYSISVLVIYFPLSIMMWVYPKLLPNAPFLIMAIISALLICLTILLIRKLSPKAILVYLSINTILYFILSMASIISYAGPNWNDNIFQQSTNIFCLVVIPLSFNLLLSKKKKINIK